MRKTVLVVLLAEFISATAFSVMALLHERNTRLHALDATLKGRSDSLLGAIHDVENLEDDVAVDPAELTTSKGDVYAVYGEGDRRLSVSASAPEDLIRRSGDGYSNRTVGSRRYRVYQRAAVRVVDRGEQPGLSLKRSVTIVYATRTEHLGEEIFEAAEYYLVMSLVLLMITALLLILLLRRVLRPISDLATEAGSISVSSLQFVAPSSALQLKELQPLAKALTAAIGGLRQALEKERRFVSDASHELKTAVAVVRSTIQVLMMRVRSQAEYAEGLEHLLQDNRRVEDLVAQMLTLARMESDNPSTGGRTDLVSSVESTISKLQSFAEAHNVSWKVDAVPSVMVPVTPEKLDVLVSNLLLNAVQHSNCYAPVEVSVAIESEKAWLRVQDHGKGIGAEALSHVFERFYREDTSRTRTTGGAGLGLAICKAIVDASRGIIEMRSSPGRGTLVIVSWDLAQAVPGQR